MYKNLHGKYPDDLKVVLDKSYRLGEQKGIFQQEHLKTISRSNNGYPIDPFGKRYLYDSENGKIRSQTEKYKEW